MGESAEATVRAFLALWEKPSVDELLGYFSDDAVWVDGPRGVHRGRDAIRAELEASIAMIPTNVMEVTALVAQGSTVMMERVDHFEMNGQAFDMPIAGFFELDDELRITRWREYYDLASIVDEITARFAQAT